MLELTTKQNIKHCTHQPLPLAFMRRDRNFEDKNGMLSVNSPTKKEVRGRLLSVWTPWPPKRRDREGGLVGLSLLILRRFWILDPDTRYEDRL